MHKVSVLKREIKDDRIYVCKSDAAGRLAGVYEETMRFVVKGAWSYRERSKSMELAEFDFTGANRSARLTDACMFANRWARGVER
jgi:hypothetical protein